MENKKKVGNKFVTKNAQNFHTFVGVKIKTKQKGSSRGLNPGPPAPEAGIIPLDHTTGDYISKTLDSFVK